MLETYGYYGLGAIIFLESIGLPLPAETLVIAASLYAAGTHNLNIFLIAIIVIIATILGNIVGYFIGKKLGSAFLKHFGKYVGLNDDRLLIGRYLCHKWGRSTIVFSRFFAFLRLFASLIAGTLEMAWRRFLIADIIGGILWGGIYSLGTYYFGEKVLKLPLVEIIAVVIIVMAVLIICAWLIKKEEAMLLKKARKVFKIEEEEREPLIKPDERKSSKQESP